MNEDPFKSRDKYMRAIFPREISYVKNVTKGDVSIGLLDPIRYTLFRHNQIQEYSLLLSGMQVNHHIIWIFEWKKIDDYSSCHTQRWILIDKHLPYDNPISTK